MDDSGEEYWYARDIWSVFGYSSWRNFGRSIEKAKESCLTSGEDIGFHFAEVRKMAEIGLNKAKREIEDIKLTRYACYLIAQNGDPKIPEIAFTQMYFALQTRKQEVLEQNIEEIERLVSRNQLKETELEFGKTIYERGVTEGSDIAEIKSAGDKELFGGNSTIEMKNKLGVKKGPLANVLPTVTLKAKDLATEMTTVKTKEKKLYGKIDIKNEHKGNNSNVRQALVRSDIIPENLPPAEDILKVEKRHKEQKKIASDALKSELPSKLNE